jgi:hypothetical protein
MRQITLSVANGRIGFIRLEAFPNPSRFPISRILSVLVVALSREKQIKTQPLLA